MGDHVNCILSPLLPPTNRYHHLPPTPGPHPTPLPQRFAPTPAPGSLATLRCTQRRSTATSMSSTRCSQWTAWSQTHCATCVAVAQGGPVIPGELHPPSLPSHQLKATPLHLAVSRGHAAIVARLLADPRVDFHLGEKVCAWGEGKSLRGATRLAPRGHLCRTSALRSAPPSTAPPGRGTMTFASCEPCSRTRALISMPLTRCGGVTGTLAAG